MECQYCCAMFNSTSALNEHVNRLHKDKFGNIIRVVDKTKINTVEDRKKIMLASCSECFVNCSETGISYNSKLYPFSEVYMCFYMSSFLALQAGIIAEAKIFSKSGEVTTFSNANDYALFFNTVLLAMIAKHIQIEEAKIAINAATTHEELDQVVI